MFIIYTIEITAYVPVISASLQFLHTYRFFTEIKFKRTGISVRNIAGNTGRNKTSFPLELSPAAPVLFFKVHKKTNNRIIFPVAEGDKISFILHVISGKFMLMCECINGIVNLGCLGFTFV